MTAPPLLLALGAPLGLLLLIAAVPVVVLFLLKRRRRDVPVGSVLLWSQVLREDLARQPFRRPREWLSLLLLLLAVLGLGLAAADLRSGKPEGGQSIVVVLDVSASMATVEDGDSRFERARNAVAAAFRGLEDGDGGALVLAAAPPRIASHLTEDKDLLAAAAAEAEVEAVEADLGAAIDAAVRMARPEGGQPAAVAVFSDFAGPELDPARWAAAGVPLRFVVCGSRPPNAGIVHAAVAPAPEGARLLVTVTANAVGEARRTLSLSLDGEVADAREVVVPAGGTASVVFPLPPGEPGSDARCRVALEPPDALALDDEVFAGLARRPPPRVLYAGPPDLFVERLPHAFPGLELVTAEPGPDGAAKPADGGTFDLAIVAAPLDGAARLPARVVLALGVPPSGSGIEPRGVLDAPALLDWDRRHPALRDLGFENLICVRSQRLEVPEGAKVLVRVTGGPQLVEAPASDRQLLVWASAPGDSNLMLLPAFPLLLRNLLGESLGGVEAEIHRAAVPLQVPAGLRRLQGRVRLSVDPPSGASRDATLDASEPWFWPGRLDPGIYAATSVPSGEDGSGSPAGRLFGVSLLSESETRALPSPPAPRDLPGAEVSVTAIDSWRAERPLWPWLAAAAALLLAAEALVMLLRRRG